MKIIVREYSLSKSNHKELLKPILACHLCMFSHQDDLTELPEVIFNLKLKYKAAGKAGILVELYYDRDLIL